MVLRLVFDRLDLQRVRLARGAEPMWESMFGLQKAKLGAVPAPLVGWRQEVARGSLVPGVAWERSHCCGTWSGPPATPRTSSPRRSW